MVKIQLSVNVRINETNCPNLFGQQRVKEYKIKFNDFFASEHKRITLNKLQPVSIQKLVINGKRKTNLII